MNRYTDVGGKALPISGRIIRVGMRAMTKTE